MENQDKPQKDFTVESIKEFIKKAEEAEKNGKAVFINPKYGNVFFVVKTDILF